MLFAAAALAPTLAAEPAVRSQPPTVMPPVDVTEAKTHTLFMGADLDINLDRDVYPIRNVVGSDWVIVINNENHEISSKHGAVDLKITPKLKLAEGEATIVGFNRQPGYSWHNDPSVLLTVGLTNAGTLSQSLLEVAHDAQNTEDTIENKALAGASTAAKSDQTFGEAGMMPNLQGNNLHAITGAKGWQSNPTTRIQAQQAAAMASGAAEPTGRLATQGLDAMDVDFSISSPKALPEPYVVTITRFHPAGSKPGAVQNLVYARALDPIGPVVTHVQLRADRLPAPPL